jgi:alanine-synthesizing transaminase
MREAQVAVAPGIGFGEYGDTHVRIGLVENVQRTRQAVRNIKTFLGNTGQVLEASEKQRMAGTER